ncbi:neuraminidase-like domain-containing protein [Mameliella sp.]|uniref:Tc toxin subunit A-related protein n=1 Tax=Mameliella sp. TaxID=1924940 RepID=UPI003BAC3984
MPRIIAIRLLSETPVTPGTFTNYLEDLEITVFDASFDDPAAENPASELGTAEYIAPATPLSTPPVDTDVLEHDPNTTIVQHDGVNPDSLPLAPVPTMFAVGTAVIEVPDGVPAAEHETVDLRITMERNGATITHKRRYFNVPTTNGNLPGDPLGFQLIPASLYLFLPAPGVETGGTLNVPEDGTEPNFDQLFAAVTNVMDDDPGDTNAIDNLSPIQARHIASEIVWDRAARPLPVPDAPLNQIYTLPFAEGDGPERTRAMFEGDLKTYQVGNDATAERLANFVFTMSAALSIADSILTGPEGDRAALTIPAEPGDAETASARIKLTGLTGTAPFVVPAAYIYALTATLPLQVTVEQRFRMVIFGNETGTISTLQEAVHNGIVALDPGTNLHQAARRLSALGGARENGLPECPAGDEANVTALIAGWLAEQDEEISTFWSALDPAGTRGHFLMVLCAITHDHSNLVAAIRNDLDGGVTTISALRAVTDEQWLALFQGDPSLLPPFTHPGSIAEQTRTFLRNLRKFFDAALALSAPTPAQPGTLPLLGENWDDILSNLSGDIENFDPAANGALLDSLFPDDPAGRAEFVAWLECLQSALALTAGIAPEELRFSVTEALWARGFVTPDHFAGFDLDALTTALIGTVAHAHASTILANAAAAGAEPLDPIGPFAPVNPWGALTNCIPPKHVSPLGPVAYLKEMLQVTEAATCDDPLAATDGANTLGAALSGRRGPIGQLAASHSNACIPLPQIDMVNETLEHVVVTGFPPGTIRDTQRDTLGGHTLDTHPNPPAGATPHAAQTLFCALPEHSTPAIPTAEQAAWETLAEDFSACTLPYNQPLDVTRSTLKALGTSRYATMRAFSREIHSFVHAPGSVPADFQNHLWRYPVPLPLALDYLCITQEEYDVLYSPGQLGPAALPEHYGFPGLPGVDPDAWMEEVVILSVFLERTCLSYCEFRELVQSGFVDIVVRHRRQDDLPECEPCCLEEYRLEFPSDPGLFGPLKRLIVFIRLWRRLNQMPNARYSFAELADIATVLTLFNGNTANAMFIPQLAAFQMLRDDFGLALVDKNDPPGAGSVGANRTHLLAFWAPGATKAQWALDHLLNRIQQYAIGTYHCPCRPPEFIKLLRSNMDPVSRLAGFDPDTAGREWDASPRHTLRMAEILAKIYASKFEVGDLLFLFTVDPQLQGGDPFPAQTRNEARDLPFDLPDNEDENTLFALRDVLRHVTIDPQEASTWTWARMGKTLRETYGMPDGTPEWTALGTHFFPDILEAEGLTVAPADRVWRANLPAGSTSEAMWNTPEGPFRYLAGSQELETRVPLVDPEVIAKLARIRQLTAAEQAVVSTLYMAPRALLAFFGFLFENQTDAEFSLLETTSPADRWAWFQNTFARFHARSLALADHLAAHISRVTGDRKKDGAETALLVLRHLWADENAATGPWENDSGAVPGVQWTPRPNGGAFHALHGVVGTGLIVEYRSDTPLIRWRETRGGIEAFGSAENATNGPIPTVLPAMNTVLTQEQLDYVSIRNGYAMGNEDGTPVGGAEPFTLTWRGLLLIEEGGKYGFRAGAPRPGSEFPDFEALERFHRWRVMLRQGQKTLVLLAHGHEEEEAPPDCAKAIHLERGFYEIEIEFERLPLVFDGPEDICAQETGFQLKYDGPDSGSDWQVIPHDKLFIGTGERLDADLDTGTTQPGVFGVLAARHVVSVRSMRRTYQRAFKALLFADRFALGAVPVADSGQSELGYMLSQPEAFAGQSYFDPGGGFQPHRANFDFNLFPVLDNYFPPLPADDQRASPSHQRSSALFDWWERLFDYSVMRADVAGGDETHPVLLFHEAAEAHVDEPAQLLRHIRVGIRQVPLVLDYFDPFAAGLTFEIDSGDLIDDRWAIRVWRADKWIDRLRDDFLEVDIDVAKPHLWAAHPVDMGGLSNLAQFYRDGLIENGDPCRYKEIETLNDGLRERGRDALVAYLTAMNRLPLPWGGFATRARDLSDLFLQDADAGLCQKLSRVEEAIRAVQQFVDRARLGLEAGFTPGPAFASAWERHFVDFRTWQACKRREIYRENWIGWSEEAVVKGSEAFRFLESELRRNDLTLPIPGGGVHWSGPDVPPATALTLLQKHEPATLQRLEAPRQGIGLKGTPDRHARPDWLSPIPGTSRRDDGVILSDTSAAAAAGGPGASSGRTPDLPMWFEAPVRLGTRFLRIAAAGLPYASATYTPKCTTPDPTICCKDCGRNHPPVMEEYYFWLDVSEEFLPVEQVAEWVSATDGDGDDVDRDSLPVDGTGAPIVDTVWHDPQALPSALAWAPRQIARLNWCRVHNGEFQTPRRSSEGVLLQQDLPAGQPDLTFRGRIADSLFFDVVGGVERVGVPGPPSPGFRYDLAPDDAIPLPELTQTDEPPIPGGLPAFPWFAFTCPGDPILPNRTFATVLAVAQHLSTHCRYEEALRWLEQEFPPLQGDNTWAECDRPNRPDPIDPDPTIPDDTPDDTPNTPVPVPAVLPPRRSSHPGECCCASDPVSDQRAERRLIMMTYGEILLDWAQALIRKDAPEAYQRARTLTETARRILGDLPKTVVTEPDDIPAAPIRDVTLACAPLNPRLMCLYNRAADIEGQIHACLDSRRHKSGRPNDEQPFFGDDPRRECWQISGDACLDAAFWCRRRSPHRFSVLVERARRAASECANMGRQLLQAYQQGDAEYLSSLNTKHQRQVADLTLDIRKNQYRDADWNRQALVLAKEHAITNLTFYQGLLAAGLLSGEAQYEPLIGTSTGLRSAGNVVEAIGQAMNLIPDPNVGLMSFVTLPPGKKLAMIFSSAGTVVNVAADIVNTVASLGLTKDGWERRADQWEHNRALSEIDVARIEREILAAERRRDAALRELNNYRQNMANTAEVEDYLRDKFTSHELFLWLQKETAALYAQCHDLALQCAWDAERAFNFERELSADRFIAMDMPDTLHERLLDGERLSLALARMQKAYEDRDRRPYELMKHISLREHFPSAFLQLISTGRCVIELPEWLFDCDNPGHFLRRIRSLSVTLPCIVGPYQGVNCKVTLLASSIRVSPEVFAPDHRCCDDTGCNSGYEALPDDPRIVHLHGAAEAIATSSGQSDAGLFTLDLNDLRYLPFEYQGAACKLCIELPAETNRFDIDTLSDLVLHMQYTAHEGGDRLRAAAAACAERHLPGSGTRFIDAKRELPGLWRTMPAPMRHGIPASRDGEYLGLRLDRGMFPFLTGNRRPLVNRIQVLFEAPGADPSRHHDVIFFAGEAVETIKPDTCREGVFTIDCVADAAWPGFFHGVLDINAVEIAGRDGTSLGVLSFHPEIRRLCNVWLLFSYSATEAMASCDWTTAVPENGCRV